MNIRRGVNRLFIVAWVVYAVWLAWYAFNTQVDTELNLAMTSYEICVTQNRSFDQSKECSDKHLQEVHQIIQDRNERIRRPSWIGMVLLAMIVPPLVVYSLVLLAVKIACWVVAGFRTPKPGT